MPERNLSSGTVDTTETGTYTDKHPARTHPAPVERNLAPIPKTNRTLISPSSPSEVDLARLTSRRRRRIDVPITLLVGAMSWVARVPAQHKLH